MEEKQETNVNIERRWRNLKNNLWGWKGGRALGGDGRGARAGDKEWREGTLDEDEELKWGEDKLYLWGEDGYREHKRPKLTIISLTLTFFFYWLTSHVYYKCQNVIHVNVPKHSHTQLIKYSSLDRGLKSAVSDYENKCRKALYSNSYLCCNVMWDLFTPSQKQNKKNL